MLIASVGHSEFVQSKKSLGYYRFSAVHFSLATNAKVEFDTAVTSYYHCVWKARYGRVVGNRFLLSPMFQSGAALLSGSPNTRSLFPGMAVWYYPILMSLKRVMVASYLHRDVSVNAQNSIRNVRLVKKCTDHIYNHSAWAAIAWETAVNLRWKKENLLHYF